jgi:hypothetical protein
LRCGRVTLVRQEVKVPILHCRVGCMRLLAQPPLQMDVLCRSLQCGGSAANARSASDATLTATRIEPTSPSARSCSRKSGGRFFIARSYSPASYGSSAGTKPLRSSTHCSVGAFGAHRPHAAPPRRIRSARTLPPPIGCHSSSAVGHASRQVTKAS